MPLALHFYPEVALKLGAGRIHLPLWKLEQMDKKVLRQFKLVGTSVHSAKDAQRAVSLGASYVTAGHVFETDCKKGLPARGLDFLREVCQSVDVPVYAIGGINMDPEKIQAVMDCGADAACVMSGLMNI